MISPLMATHIATTSPIRRSGTTSSRFRGRRRLASTAWSCRCARTSRSTATAQRKLQRFNPRPESYDIAFYDSYTVAQRVAATFRKGRVLLAGDSAHLNSPIGAMGMNSGIHDAVNLAANLIRVLRGEESDAALDRYVRQRRHVATGHVQTATIANKQNMEQRDPIKRQRHRDEMRRRAEDPALAKAFLMRTALIDSLRDAEKIP